MWQHRTVGQSAVLGPPVVVECNSVTELVNEGKVAGGVVQGTVAGHGNENK